MKRIRNPAAARPRPRRPRGAGIPEVPTTVPPTPAGPGTVSPTTVQAAIVQPAPDAAKLQAARAADEAVEEAIRRMVEAAYT
jgi:hypothetical protein